MGNRIKQSDLTNQVGHLSPVLFPKALPATVAHYLVSKAIANGTLIRPTKGDNCNKECKPFGHRPDYSKPLKVDWLCNSCHKIVHSGPWKQDITYKKTEADHED